MQEGVGTRCVQQGEGEKSCQHPLSRLVWRPACYVGSSLRGRGWCPTDLHASQGSTQTAELPSLTSSLFIALRWLNEASVYLLFSFHEFHREFGYFLDTRRASPVLNDVL